MMRIWALFFAMSTLLACKSTRSSHRIQDADLTEPIETEDQLPACDDINLGRIYWVRSLNHQVLCAEGGTWTPRQVDPDSKTEPGIGPRRIE